MSNLDERELLKMRENDLVENPDPRLPVCLCLDTSGSMNTVEEGTYQSTGKTRFVDGKEYELVNGGVTRLNALQKGVQSFYDSLLKDDVASGSVEISIVSFNDRAEKLLDFAGLERQEIPTLEADGNTHMGEGIELALELLEKRKEEYRAKGVDYFQPWMVLMTDGEPNGDSKVLEDMIDRVRRLQQNKKMLLIPVAIGSKSDFGTLNRISPFRHFIRLSNNTDFSKFFDWLSKSVAQTSSSAPGDEIDISIAKVIGWPRGDGDWNTEQNLNGPEKSEVKDWTDLDTE